MRTWLMAARLRTLPAAVAPVLVGTSIAITRDVFRPGAFIAALLGAILIQVGTNLSNDYSDARRGADTEERLGPMRVTAGGLVPPRTVLLWTYLTFAAAALCGVYLVIVAGWELLVLGVLSILAGVLYTGGPRPYGYEGLGEVFVFLFFGIVAVAGSAFAQLQEWPWEAFALAVPVGLLVTAILVVNNIRDMDTDRRAGKLTLAVRLGRERARTEYTALMALGFLVLLPIAAIEIADSDSWSALWWLLPWLLAPLAGRLVAIVRTHVDGPTLNGALARTAGMQLVFCVLLSAGILIS
jgi:1,4-dihydroxy-2-naphthoate octaprenyltransferase